MKISEKSRKIKILYENVLFSSYGKNIVKLSIKYYINNKNANKYWTIILFTFFYGRFIFI